MTNSTEMQDYYENTRRPVIPIPTTRLGKLGCGIALMVWFTILLIPCAMFWLASGNNITISRAQDFPESANYPIFQVQLIMEIRNRGLQITRSDVFAQTDNQICITTSVGYLLWQRTGSDDLSAQFCDCFQRESIEDAWGLTSTVMQPCQ